MHSKASQQESAASYGVETIERALRSLHSGLARAHHTTLPAHVGALGIRSGHHDLALLVTVAVGENGGQLGDRKTCKKRGKDTGGRKGITRGIQEPTKQQNQQTLKTDLKLLFLVQR